MTTPSDDGFDLRPIRMCFEAGIVLVLALRIVEAIVMHRISLFFDPWSLAILVVGQFVLDRTIWPAVATCSLAVPLCTVLYWLQPALGVFALPIALGTASIGVIGSTMLVAPDRRRRSLLAVAVASLAMIGQQIAQLGQAFTTTDALTFDNRAYLVDLSMGFNPVGLVLSALDALPDWLKSAALALLTMTYMALVLMMAFIVLVQINRQSPRWKLSVAAFVLAGAAGGMLYHVFPAAGPRFAFAGFPLLPQGSVLTPAAAFLDPSFARNCMPSLHTTWALLIFFNAAGLSRPVRCAAWIFATLTITATLALGEHYLIDLVVAVPFAVGVQATARALIARRWPSASVWVCGGCVAVWLAVLVGHAAWLLEVPGLTLFASVVTVAAGVIAHLADGRLDTRAGSNLTLHNRTLDAKLPAGLSPGV